jgi:hypothetical protein
MGYSQCAELAGGYRSYCSCHHPEGRFKSVAEALKDIPMQLQRGNSLQLSFFVFGIVREKASGIRILFLGQHEVCYMEACFVIR